MWLPFIFQAIWSPEQHGTVFSCYCISFIKFSLLLAKVVFVNPLSCATNNFCHIFSPPVLKGHMSFWHLSSIGRLSTYHILIFSSKTIGSILALTSLVKIKKGGVILQIFVSENKKPILAKLDGDNPWIVSFQNCVWSLWWLDFLQRWPLGYK